MKQIEMGIVVNRQKNLINNIDFLELLRVLKLYFPKRYKEKVIEWELSKSRFYNHLCNKEKTYKIFLSYSPHCGTFLDGVNFKNEFDALEFSLISALNGRDTKIKTCCNDKSCNICY